MKLLITLSGEKIAPRFDLCTEVVIAAAANGNVTEEPRTVLLPSPSADELCSLIIREGVTLVICGGIEEPHYQYLQWKKIAVIDRLIGTLDAVLPLALTGRLQAGAIVHPDASRENP